MITNRFRCRDSPRIIIQYFPLTKIIIMLNFQLCVVVKSEKQKNAISSTGITVNPGKLLAFCIRIITPRLNVSTDDAMIFSIICEPIGTVHNAYGKKQYYQCFDAPVATDTPPRTLVPNNNKNKNKSSGYAHSRRVIIVI